MRAAFTSRSGSTPVIFATQSSGKFFRASLKVSKFSQRSATKALSSSPSSTIMRHIPIKSATSVPYLWRIQRSASRTKSTSMGLATMSLAPLRTARRTFIARTGWASVALVPMARMHLAFLKSSMLLVIAPLPNVVARPATVGACQRRAQWSTLLVRSTALPNFCIR